MSIDDVKKSKRGRPAVDTEPLTVRAPRDLLEALDAFSADEPDRPSRPESVRRLLRDHLIGLGYIDLPPAKEDAN